MTMALMELPGQMMQMPRSGWGACDPDIIQSPYGLAPFRMDWVLFTFTEVTGGHVLTAKTEINAFTVGDDEDASSQGWPAGYKKSCADTMSYDKGALAYRDENFRIKGMSVRIGHAFQFDANDATQRNYTETLGPYVPLFQSIMLDLLCVEFTFGKTQCNWILGNPSDWPTNGGPTHGGTISNGANAALGAFIGFTSGVAAGAVDEPDKLKVKLTSSPSDIFVADRGDTPPTGSISVPVKVTLWGARDCSGCQPVCLPPGVNQLDAMAALRQLVSNLTPQQVQAVLAKNGG